ncbi:MAG: hypothetical protein MHM6MM_005086 [Cercozoa sp. M6MM]
MRQAEREKRVAEVKARARRWGQQRQFMLKRQEIRRPKTAAAIAGLTGRFCGACGPYAHTRRRSSAKAPKAMSSAETDCSISNSGEEESEPPPLKVFFEQDDRLKSDLLELNSRRRNRTKRETTSEGKLQKTIARRASLKIEMEQAVSAMLEVTSSIPNRFASFSHDEIDFDSANFLTLDTSFDSDGFSSSENCSRRLHHSTDDVGDKKNNPKLKGFDNEKCSQSTLFTSALSAHSVLNWYSNSRPGTSTTFSANTVASHSNSSLGVYLDPIPYLKNDCDFGIYAPAQKNAAILHKYYEATQNPSSAVNVDKLTRFLSVVVHVLHKATYLLLYDSRIVHQDNKGKLQPVDAIFDPDSNGIEDAVQQVERDLWFLTQKHFSTQSSFSRYHSMGKSVAFEISMLMRPSDL